MRILKAGHHLTYRIIVRTNRTVPFLKTTEIFVIKRWVVSASILKGAMSPHTHARANENKLEKVGPTFSSCVGDFGRLFLSV